jgi:hypothetical protein
MSGVHVPKPTISAQQASGCNEQIGRFPSIPVSSTVAAGGLAIEAADGALVPKTTQPYVSPLVPGE